MARGLGLVVGLKGVDPAAYGGWNGSNGCWGCELDADNISRILRQQGFDVHALKTAKATSNNILRSLKSASENLGPEDIFVFYFSGHGGQQPDLNGDEQDGKDETLVAFDREIVDDELNAIWTRFRPGVRIVMLSDSCNSGTNYKYHGTIDNPTPIIPIPNEKTDKAMSAQMIHMGGCRDGFSSMGYESGGAFTMALCTAWSAGSFRGSYRDLYEKTVSRVGTAQYPQFNEYGRVTADFRKQQPFTIGRVDSVRVFCELSFDGVDLSQAQEIISEEAGPCLLDAFSNALAIRGGEASVSCSGDSSGHVSCTGSVTVHF